MNNKNNSAIIDKSKKLTKLASEFNVLYLDDDEKMRYLFSNLLSGSFKNVYYGEDGSVGLEIFDKYEIDFIITDIHMPNIDGLEFAQIIKNKNKSIPVILVTAFTDTELFIKAIDIGVDKFLIKPFNAEKLVDVLTEVLTALKTKKDKIEFETLSNDLTNELEIKTNELNLFKDDMITIFTHELKTPLHAIINFSEYIHKNIQKELSEKRIEKISELSEKIKSNGLAQFSLIETLLEVSKYKSGKIILNRTEIKPERIIKSIINRYKSMYKIKITFEIEQISIIIDKNAAAMVFENLYSNALKHANSRIHVTFKQIDNGKFLLSVEDDGEGVKEENRKKIFNQFEQIDKTVVTREKKGTGLGLYLVKLITDKGQHEVKVEDSALLGGAKFSIIGGIKND